MPSGPKTSKYINRHTEEARQRENERTTNAQEAKRKAQEDAQWVETDKMTLKRLEKQREEERKAAERAAREAEKKDQLEQEESEAVKKAPVHVQRRMNQKELAKMLANYDREQQAIRGGNGASSGAIGCSEALAAQPELPTSNPNKAKGAQSAAGAESDTITASGNPAEVLASLQRQSGISGEAAIPQNRHIGKRARVLYRAFCAEHLPTLKEEHPNLRRTQYNDLLWEMWQSSPQNPFVLRSEAADRARLEEERRWMEGGDEDDDREEAEETEERIARA